MIRTHLFLIALPLVLAVCPIGYNYESFFNKCYRVAKQHIPFLTAEQECIAQGGHLVTLNSVLEGSYVTELVTSQNSSVQSYWIGYNRLMYSTWTWTSGQPSTFSNFAPDQPSDPSPYQCAVSRTVDSLWIKDLCNFSIPFVCDAPPNNSTCPDCHRTTTSAPVTNCGELVCSAGYTMYPGNCRCYKVDSEGYYYKEAVKHCEREKATLAKVISEEHNTFLFGLAGEFTENFNPWIGLVCPNDKTADCYWPDGSKLSGYSNFETGSSLGIRTFMDTWNVLSEGKWVGVKDDAKDSVFCEKEAFIR